MDITYVCIIILGTKKKIKIKFTEGGGSWYRAKTAKVGEKWHRRLIYIKKKEVYHLWTSHMYALSLEVLKKKLKLNFPRAEGPRTEQKLQGSDENWLRRLIYIKKKEVYHLWTSHMYALSLEVLKKKLKLNFPRAEGPRTEQKLWLNEKWLRPLINI